jgi:hypothetical protein
MGENTLAEKGNEMGEKKALELYLLGRKGTEKTDEDIQDLIDRARLLKGMKKIEWKPIDK